MSRTIRSWGNDTNTLDGVIADTLDDFIDTNDFGEVMPNEEDIIDQVEDPEPVRTPPINGSWVKLGSLPKISKSAIPETNKQTISDMEKKEWCDRVQAMTSAEREFMITRFSTSELYEEIHRRAMKDAEYIANMRKLVDEYDNV